MSTPLPADQIEGIWDLVSWTQKYDDGRELHPFGEEAAGTIAYVDGRVNVLITAGNRPDFTTGGQWNAEAQEKAAAYETCLAYGGTYRFDGEWVEHHIQHSLFPNWAGAVQRRRVQWDGETLSLTTARLEEGTSEARVAELSFRRAGTASN